MLRLNIFFCAIYFLSGTCVYAQPNRRVWLGAGMDTLYDKDSFHRRVFDSTAVYYGLGCERVISQFTGDQKDDYKVINAGFILQAKSTNKIGEGKRAVFTNGDDSCEVRYEVRTDITRIGRSAALSIINLFSKPENKVPQEEPHDRTDLIQVAGKISTNYFDQPFRFVNDYRMRKYQPKGWLVLFGDTLYIKPITTQVNKRGKLKHPKYIPDIGYLLMRDDKIYAAVDQSGFPYMFYVLGSLSKKEKMVITAFLFTTMDH